MVKKKKNKRLTFREIILGLTLVIIGSLMLAKVPDLFLWSAELRIARGGSPIMFLPLYIYSGITVLNIVFGFGILLDKNE